jgi:hypothetical protein
MNKDKDIQLKRKTKTEWSDKSSGSTAAHADMRGLRCESPELSVNRQNKRNTQKVNRRHIQQLHE